VEVEKNNSILKKGIVKNKKNHKTTPGLSYSWIR